MCTIDGKAGSIAGYTCTKGRQWAQLCAPAKALGYGGTCGGDGSERVMKFIATSIDNSINVCNAGRNYSSPLGAIKLRHWVTARALLAVSACHAVEVDARGRLVCWADFAAPEIGL